MKFRILTTLFCLLSCWCLPAQSISIKGKISDDNSLPVVGAFVLEQSSTNGTSTDLDGVFSISVPADAVLEISCMGYVTKIVSVRGQSSLDIILEADNQYLDEIVVVGYGTQKSKDLTAPVVNVKGSELSKQLASNPMSALQGKVAGVHVINSGAPGAGPAVKIRGTGSIGDYASPLYIVDGVFVDNLDFISSNDIQELTVLKDASASAIYGVRAANGVVIISTKRGIGEVANISYDGYAGVQLPVNVMKLAGKDQYIELLNAANASKTNYVAKNPDDYPASTDWYSTLLRPAFTHNHAIDVSGASAKTSYSMGLSYFYQDGIMKAPNDYERLNFRARLEQSVNEHLQIGANALVSRYDRQYPNSNAFFQAFVNPPVYNVFNEANPDAYPVKYDSPQLYGFSNSYGNPYATAQYYDNREEGLNLVFSSFVELKMLSDKLKLRSSYNLDFKAYKAQSYTPEYLVGGSQGAAKSSMSKTYGIGNKHIIDNTLSYSDTIGQQSFTAMLGQSTRIEQFSGMTGSAVDVPGYDDQGMYLGNGSARDRFVDDKSPGPFRHHGLSFFTRGTYNYADKYLASLTFRADGSSKYNQKWGFFPSLGLGWVMTSEDFMKRQSFFDYLKLRASWGLLGNDNVPANSMVILGSSGTASSGVFGDQLVDGVGAQTVLQNVLRWEVVNEFDLGADFSLVGGRLSGELDYYHRATNNVVFYVPIATGGGTAELLSNNGTVLNQGIELGLHWDDRISSDFSYNVGLNLTTISNRVIRLEGRDYIPGANVRGNFSTRTQVGYPIGAFWGYEVDGVFASEKEALLADVRQSVVGPGYLRYVDQNGDKIINEDDKTYLGSPIPWLLGGIELGANYKAWDFGLSLQAQVGNKILNAKRMDRGVFPDGNYDLDFYQNAWRPERKSDTYPSAEAYTNGFMQQANDFFVEDGSYIRIQNVQIGYTFTKIKGIKSLRISLNAQRPYTFFRYKGFTPEVAGSPIATGIDTSTYPMQSIYTLGAKLNF